MMKSQFPLKGKATLATGASYGIGFAIASPVAKAGAKIAFNNLKQDFVAKGLATSNKGIKAIFAV